MSKFPRMYAESTITRMYKKLGLPDETVSLLHDYFDAFSNLYQVLPLKDAFKIIESQNKGLITLDEFLAFSEIARHEEHFYYILSKNELYLDAPDEEPIDREIVHESLVDIDFDEYYNLVENQRDKPLFIPAKQELLNYKGDYYIADTPQVRAMESFFRTRLKMNAENAEEMVDECLLAITCGDNPLNEIFAELEIMKISFTEKQLDEFVALFSDLHNNTRLPQNRGFTPKELSIRRGGQQIPKAISFGPNITAAMKSGEMNVLEFGMSIAESDIPQGLKIQMLSELAKIQGGNAEPINIPRNALCPCGSGKKYKRCCGK